jgi:RNA polymerase sigma factor (sigma-70 family)
MNGQSDISLLQSYAQTRDAQSFAELVRRHAGLVFAVARRLTGNPQDAEDIAQTCFMEMARKASSITISPAGWLHRAATCRSRDAIRADIARRQREAQAAANARQFADPQWEELAAFVDELIDKLPEELRIPLVLHYLEGRTQSDVAAEIGVEQSTISRRLAQGVEQLRQNLAKAGIVASVGGLTALLLAHPAQAAPAALISATGKMAIAGIGGPGGASKFSAARLIFGSAAAVLLAAITSYLIYQLSTPSRKTGVDSVPLQPAPGTSSPLASAQSKTITGVRTLGWNQKKENTFAGSLEAALAATAHPADYPTIMGVSGLAFRVRWFDRPENGGWDGSAPVGTMPHPLEELRRGTGWTLRILWINPKNHPMPDEYMPQIIASLNENIPVVGYEPKMNSGVFYGYEDHGRTLLMNDYYVAAGGSRYRVEEVPVNFIIPVRWSQPQPPKDTALAAMQLAMRNWYRVHDMVGSNFRFWYGQTAYEKWMADVQGAAALPGKEYASLFFVHWWNFTSLVDARAAAGKYLRSQQVHFKAETSASMGRAAAYYEEIARTGAETIAAKTIFPGRWTGKSAGDWSENMRTQELALLRRLRDLDAAAISELDEALSQEGIITDTLKASDLEPPKPPNPHP